MNYYHKVLEAADIQIPALVWMEHDRLTEAQSPVTSHIHESCIEVLALFKGAQRYETEGGMFSLKGGEAFVTRAGEHHGHWESQSISEYICLHIDMSSATDFLGLAEHGAEQLYHQLQNNQQYVLKMNAKCISLLREVFTSIEKGMHIYAQGLFVGFLHLLFSSNHQNEAEQYKLERIVSYIHERIYENIALEDICAACGISLSGLKHKFKEFTGETPRAYINRMKIDEAKKLLQEGKNVTEVSMLLSFNSSNYFSTVFKKHTRKAPTQYVDTLR